MTSQKIDFEEGKIIYSQDKIILNYNHKKNKIRAQFIFIGLITILSGLVFKYFPIVISIPVGFMVIPLLFALILSSFKNYGSDKVAVELKEINFIKELDEQILISYKNTNGKIESKELQGFKREDLKKLETFLAKNPPILDFELSKF